MKTVTKRCSLENLQTVVGFVNVTSVAAKLGYPYELLLSPRVWQLCVKHRSELQSDSSELMSLHNLIIESSRQIDFAALAFRNYEFDYWVTTKRNGASVAIPLIARLIEHSLGRKSVILSLSEELTLWPRDDNEDIQSCEARDGDL